MKPGFVALLLTGVVASSGGCLGNLFEYVVSLVVSALTYWFWIALIISFGVFCVWVVVRESAGAQAEGEESDT
jgi:hypothetical protein